MTIEPDYIDPILFSEGIYSDASEYNQAIDALAIRIHTGEAVPKGREPRQIDLDALTNRLIAAQDANDKLLQDAVEVLPAEQRYVVELHYYQGLSEAEITKNFNFPERTVRGYLRAALTRLQEVLSRAGDNNTNINNRAA